MPKVSIIIRAKNEEKWLTHCLQMISAQKETDWEIVLVDTQSQDATVDIAKRQGVKKIISIEKYLPGDALNQGIRESTGKYIVCLSAHCIPVNDNWLSNLLQGFETENVVGVYGRQIPLMFSDLNDKRDLLITFGLDRRLQIKDYFFHNANSAILRSIWEQVPFSESVTNIEDRLWAKEVTQKGLHLLYEPIAVVYHHHGIHHSLNKKRLKSTMTIFEKSEPILSGIPNSMKPENVPIAAICPVYKEPDLKKLDALLANLKQNRINQIFLFSEMESLEDYCTQKDVFYIKRPLQYYPPNSLGEVMKYALTQIEDSGFFPQLVIYANHHYGRPPNMFTELIEEIQYNGADTVFPAELVTKDSHTYWRKDKSGGLQMVIEMRADKNNQSQLLQYIYIYQGQLKINHLISHEFPYNKAERDCRHKSLGIVLKWNIDSEN